MGSTYQQACWCFVDSHSPSVSREGLVPRTTWWNDETLPWLEWLKSVLGFLRSKSVSLEHSNDITEAFRNPRVFGEDFYVVLFLERKTKQTFQNMCKDEIPDSLLPNSQGFFQTEVCSWLRTTQTIDWWTPPQVITRTITCIKFDPPKDGYIIPWSPC